MVSSWVREAEKKSKHDKRVIPSFPRVFRASELLADLSERVEGEGERHSARNSCFRCRNSTTYTDEWIDTLCLEIFFLPILFLFRGSHSLSLSFFFYNLYYISRGVSSPLPFFPISRSAKWKNVFSPSHFGASTVWSYKISALRFLKSVPRLSALIMITSG